jgi:hypothetical protein
MKSLRSFAILAVALSLIGCGMGDAPPPMTREDAKNALNNLSPEDKIRYYDSSPMPAAEKQKKIAEVEQQYGVKASDVLGNKGAPAPGGGQ